MKTYRKKHLRLNKILQVLRKSRHKQDLFTRIRFRLTLTYSIILMVFLLVFSIIAVSVLFIVVARDQVQAIRSEADQEVQAYQRHSNFPENDARFFSYVVNQEGQVLYKEEVIPELRTVILHKLTDWKPQDNDIKMISFDLQHGHSVRVLAVSKIVYENGRPVGILYTGNNIIFYWHIFQMLIHVFLFLSVAFILISAFIGQSMSKRAMVPIVKSFTRQQEFVADASHELRTPLSVLSYSLDVLELEEGEKFSSFSTSVLHDAKDEVRSMSRLVNDLLTLARSDSGEQVILQETVELVAIADSIVRSLTPIADNQHIQLLLDAPKNLELQGDPERLRQLLYILLDNAMKYTPAYGQVKLTLSLAQLERQSICQIQVEDTGIGIAKEEQAHIFERFYRVDKKRSREMGGAGLGLSIAKWIVDAHEGKIAVKSQPGNGSIFIIKLPLHRKGYS